MKTDRSMEAPARILVTAAGGKTGRRVARRLEAEGFEVRRGSRTSHPVFDWTRSDTWRTALDGIDAAYIAYPQSLDIAAATNRIGAFVEEAQAAGLQRLVLLTGRGEAEGRLQEKLVAESGLVWTVVRSAWFNQNFTEGGFAGLVQSGEFVLSSGDVPEPFVDLDDVAEVAATALTRPGHDGEVYEVTGPRGITLEAVAAELSVALGRTIDFVPVPHRELLEGLEADGAPEDVVDLMDFLFGTLLDGRNAHIGDGVQRALGRPPKDFADFARHLATPPSEGGSEEATVHNEQVIRRFVNEFINGGDESVLPELIHDEYVYQSPTEKVRGRTQLVDMFRGLRGAFPDMALTTHRLLASEDSTTLDFTLTGTHRGDFMGIPATERPIEIRGVVISRYDEGRIIHDWEILDTMTMLQQLGVA